MKVLRYSCCEAVFITIDGRNIETRRFSSPSTAKMLCSVNEAHSLVILENDPAADFSYKLLLGEGREAAAAVVAVAFADLLGLKPREGAFTYGTADPSKTFSFIAPDGPHTAEVLSHFGESKTVAVDGGERVEAICEGEI